MIKNYDEALKTLNDIRTYLAISRADDCVEELDKVARYFINEKHKENSTFPECIKEWEERGFKYTRYFNALKFENKSEDITINIQEWNESVMISNSNYCYARHIPYDLLNLIHKTLKSLEEMKDD